jgi:hypothetical protein
MGNQSDIQHEYYRTKPGIGTSNIGFNVNILSELETVTEKSKDYFAELSAAASKKILQ